MIDIPVRAIDALRDGRRLKRYHFDVLDDNGTVDFTITNENLVSESVKYDERMCSGTDLKFGLCEGTSLEFQYFGLENINGRRLNTSIDVQYETASGSLTWQTIPMGFFTVDQCPMQFSTGIRKVVAYNKLKSEYLDQKMNKEILEIAEVGDPGTSQEVSLSSLLVKLLEGFYIESEDRYVMDTDPYPNDASYNAICLSELDANGYATGKYLKQCYISAYLIPGYGINFDQDEYYRVLVKAKALADYYDEYVSAYVNKSVANQNASQGSYVPPSSRTTLANLMSTNTQTRQTFRISVSINGQTVFSEDLYKNQEDEILSDWFTGATGDYIIFLRIPVLIEENNYYDTAISGNELNQMSRNYVNIIDSLEPVGIEQKTLTAIEKKKFTLQDLETWQDVTLRQLQTAVFEMNCQYGQLNRVTDFFAGIELNNSALYPRDTLYPADNLYPGGSMDKTVKSAYSKLWTDTVGAQSFRYLIITYKGLNQNNQEVDYILQKTVNANGTTDYNMSDNWLFRNLIWTEQQIDAYATAMVAKMTGVTWFPFEMWGAGLPYIETGDQIEIVTREGSFTSYILQRQLNGIQNLQDTYINGELDIF